MSTIYARLVHGVVAVAISLILLSMSILPSVVVDAAIAVPLIFSLFLVLSWCAAFPFSSKQFISQGLLESIFSFVGASFINLLVLFMLPALAGYIFHLSLMQVLLFFIALCIFFSFRVSSAGTIPSAVTADSDHILFGVLVFIIGLTLVFAQYYGCWLNGDYGWHGTTIRKLAELSPIHFSNYLIKPLPLPQYGHNIWHLFLALIVYISHADTGLVWLNINLVVSVLRIAAYYLLARQMFESSRWAIVSTILYLLCCSLLSIEISGDLSDIESKWAWSSSGYPSTIARDVLLNILLYFILKGVKTGKPYLWPVGVLAATMALTHFYYIYLLIFVLITVYAASWFLKGEEMVRYRSQFIPLIFALLPALIYALAYKQSIDQPTINPIFLSVSAIGDFQHRVHMLWGRFPYISPMAGYFRNQYFFVAMLCSIPLIGSLFKPAVKLWQSMLIVPALVLAAIFFNPPLLMLAQHFNPALDRVWRIAEVMSVPLMLSGTLYWLVEQKLISFKTVRLLLLVVLVSLIPSMIQFHRQIIYTAPLWNGLISRVAVKQHAINQVIPAGSSVCVEPDISWPWATLYPHYVYMHVFPAGLPPNYDPTERINTWNAFFKGTDRMAKLERIADSEVQYIVFKESTWDSIKDVPSSYWAEQTYIPEANIVVCRLRRK